LGWLLAQAAGGNVPAFAAVLRVPLVELGKSMTLPAFVAGYPEYLAWCVEVVEGSAVSQVNRWMFWLARARCLHAKNTPVIAAFDYWADNRDRNYGNVIRSRDGQYIAIDHESLLHDVVWRKYYGMEFTLNSLLQEARLRLPASQLHRFQCDMALAAEKHAIAIQAMKTVGVKFVSDIVPDPALSAQLWTEIETFLALRAQIGWLAGELGVIV
jgi:hypothetical protein